MGARDEYVEAIKSAFVTLAVKTVLAGAASYFPFLGSGFFAFLINAVARKFFTWFAMQTELQAFFLFIDTRVGQQGRDFEAAAYKNREAQLNGTKEQKQKAEAELWAAFKNLASLKS